MVATPSGLHWGPLDSMACLTSPNLETVKTKTYQLFYDFHTIAFSTIYLLSFLPTYCYFTQNFQVLIIVALCLAFSFSFVSKGTREYFDLVLK